MSKSFDETVGLLREATIVGYNSEFDTIEIQLNTAQAIKGKSRISIPAPAPHALFHNNGLYIGTSPVIGTPIVVGQGSGNQYYFVSFKVENKDLVPDLKVGELLIQSTIDSKITLDTSNNINIGSDTTRIHIETGNKNKPKTNLITLNFENENHFTQAYREVGGLVKRDLRINTTGYDQDSKLEDDSYDNVYKIVAMDPSATPNDIITGPTKNPPFAEYRELVYEFQYQSGVTTDLIESLQYGSSKQPTATYSFPNRRKSRADTLSLTLLEPNYLMETVKGTVIDIFGNILDLNRMPLPVGKDQNTIRAEISKDKVASYLKIRELERKSLAYHFEINARKDFNQKSSANTSTLDLLDINSNADNSRLRSRFFFDIDKEGQFKINVPASSEKGNIPLLTRYENQSTYDPADNGNPNKLMYNKDNLDIFLDSFAATKTDYADSGFSFSTDRGSIKLQDDKGEAAPIDRITKSHIRHGTAHHDILRTCWALQNNQFIDYQTGEASVPVDIGSIPLLKNIVSEVIKISGNDANAGGRSGSLNLDGMLELNIGANTIDRQSLWADFAGGSVINLGRDRQLRSAVISADGDIYMQVGGFGIASDSRFVKDANGISAGVLDLRIMTAGGYAHMIRFDNLGFTIMTPGNAAIHAKGGLKLTSDADMAIECANLTIQGRLVLKDSGGTI